MTKSPQPYLALIQRALTHIEQYRPQDKRDFLAQPVLQDAILMRLQVIGENLARIRRLDEDAYHEMADDSWRKLIGLRNVISHGYESIDHEEIWQIVKEELPTFAVTIEALVEHS